MTNATRTKKGDRDGRIGERAARALADIARRTMDIETLETRKSDSLDFHDVAVWSVRAALEAAYQLGLEARTKRTE